MLKFAWIILRVSSFKIISYDFTSADPWVVPFQSRIRQSLAAVTKNSNLFIWAKMSWNLDSGCFVQTGQVVLEEKAFKLRLQITKKNSKYINLHICIHPESKFQLIFAHMNKLLFLVTAARDCRIRLKDQVSFSHPLHSSLSICLSISLSIVNYLKNLLKLLDQFELKFAWIILRVSSFKIISYDFTSADPWVVPFQSRNSQWVNFEST
jgi:hypothetical protein